MNTLSGETFTVVLLAVAAVFGMKYDPATQQLNVYKNTHQTKIGSLKTSDGVPVEYPDAESSFDYKSLLDDEYFMDVFTHLVRERIPERIVHAKGTGAHGYFEVTHDVSNICKADFLSKIGKRTKAFVRFSRSFGDRGSSDAMRDNHGFAVKFYTEEGNFDFVGISIPVFSIKDPIKFPACVHAQKKNPVTNLNDANMVWDFITLNPETMFSVVNIFTDKGFPYSYRNMPGYSIHTYQLLNETGHFHFARFSFEPDLGVKNLTTKDAMKLKVVDDDYLTRDLYNAIGRGKFPSWTFYMQVLTPKEIKDMSFDAFDVTRILPEDKYPLRPVGRLVLNKNPKNQFAEIEQAAFCPANIVPGILGAPDQLFHARRLGYRDTQLYRLGANFRKIPVNCPLSSTSNTYIRDGRAWKQR